MKKDPDGKESCEMIREMKREEIPQCVDVIRKSFLTVAEELGFTTENAPRFTAFAMSEDRLYSQLEEGRPMFVYVDEKENICGYYSLAMQENLECELNNLAVLPEYRHQGIGKLLLEHAFSYAHSVSPSWKKIPSYGSGMRASAPCISARRNSISSRLPVAICRKKCDAI